MQTFSHDQRQPQPSDLETRIERAQRQFLAAGDEPTRRRAWQRMRRLILRKPGFEHAASGPEPARAIVHRVTSGLLLAWETRSTRQ